MKGIVTLGLSIKHYNGKKPQQMSITWGFNVN